MSRIHDALKKAEQEKGVGAGSERPVPAAVAQDAGAGLEATPVASESSSAPRRPDDGLLERCPQHVWKPDRATMHLFDRRADVAGLEEFRTLRSHLDLFRQHVKLQKLLVTSPLPQEGKSFIAANLAQAMARHHERRVLLIDADLRASHMHVLLGAPSTPGMAEYLGGRADESQIIQRGPIENLFFAPAGSKVSNANELVGNTRMKQFLERVAPLFDWVIVDSPPVLPVADAKLLAEACDGVLVVVKAGWTPVDVAKKACQEFRENQCVGVVLNRAKAGSAYRTTYSNGKGNQREVQGNGVVQ